MKKKRTVEMPCKKAIMAEIEMIVLLRFLVIRM